MLTSFRQSSNIQTGITYDTPGFPQQIQVQRTGSSPTTLMTLGYSFNAARGFPNSRTNSLFSWNESFGYDNLDRLTVFNDNNGNHNQAYDTRGRITANSRLGTYSYSGTSYRQSGLGLTPTASTYYQTRAVQDIDFNAFKSPNEIHEPGHDRYSFQYNGFMQRASMFYGGVQTDKLLRPKRKHYSADGSMEISKNLTTGTTDFIFYLGGDAYSAPAIWKERHSSSPTVQNLYYLQRDYLGSIVLITDASGNAVEKRQFDAWGNIVKLTNGSNVNIPIFVILDRGYTGHEHLQSVGLIHMNARLYDPLLGRFVSPDNYVQDPLGTQNYNRYAYAMNNPLVYVDQNGEFWHYIIGAAVGGIVNLGTKLLQGKVDNFMDGVVAFGIGAASGVAIVATGGAALSATGLTATSVAGGAVVGTTTYAAGTAIQNVGNHLYFGDPLLSVKDFATGMAVSAITGGALGGVSNLIWSKGTNIWTGRPLYRVEVDDLIMTNFGGRQVNQIADDALEAAKTGTSLVTKYPANAAIAGTTERTFLMPGQVIDRYGALGGKWFSQPGVSYGARSIPPGQAPYMQFKVLKPFEVNKSLASPGMFSGQTGFGIQFQSPVGADILIKRGIIAPF